MQNIDLQRLAEPAELEEASWTILKQKIDIWFVVFVLPAAQNQWKTAALKEQLKWATYKKKKKTVYPENGTPFFDNDKIVLSKKGGASSLILH